MTRDLEICDPWPWLCALWVPCGSQHSQDQRCEGEGTGWRGTGSGHFLKLSWPSRSGVLFLHILNINFTETKIYILLKFALLSK